jgi:Chromo (CHRromatin Organisation MOdifier) domain
MEEYGVNFTEPPPDLIKGEPKWEVEKILGSRQHGQKKELQYLIKWKEYSAAENSWEWAEDVYAPELLKEFYREQPMAIKVVQIGRTEQCLSDSPSSTSSLESHSDTSTSTSPTRSPSLTATSTSAFINTTTALSTISMEDNYSWC